MFCNLHVHSALSLLDSILTVEQIVNYAKEHGQKAIAITDHGYMHGFVQQVKLCKKHGIKPIIGCEIYEVNDDTLNAKQDRNHLVLLAKNATGLRNLYKIVSFAATDGFYTKPRISIDRIADNNWGDGIICLTACQAGRLSRLVMSYDMYNADKWAEKLQSTFDYVAVEIQSHDTQEQYESNYRLIEFANRKGLPLVVTSDAHYLSPEDISAHSIFVKIGQDRDVGESYEGCYLQDENDIYENLKNFEVKCIDKAINESVHIADMIEDIDIGLENENQMPVINIPAGYSSHEKYLKHLIYSTFDEKFGHMSKEQQQERKDRIETELPVIEALGYVDYFLMCYMLLNEARARGIPLGYARGSAAGCLCLYLLNVTQIDSVLWDLDFSRFANLGRRSLADIDIDISKRRRREVIDIAVELFGKENVAPIATFNTLSTKVAIRDIGKVLHEDPTSPYCGLIPYQTRNEVASAIPTVKTLDDLGEEQEKDALLKDLVSKNKKLQKVYEEFPLWFEYVMRLEGLCKSKGKHAAGVLITPMPIVHYAPVCLDADKNIMCQLEMHSAMDDLKLVKMDFLGLKTLDVVDDALKNAHLTWQDVDINRLNFADRKVYDEVYKSGNTVGVFQMESLEAKKMCMDAQANNIDDIIAVNAANRPGTKDSFPEYCKNKINPEDAVVIHDDLKVIFGKTHYILLYQEQALAMFRYAGFPETEVDNARRCLDENTLITMADGSLKKIKDIQVGDLVLSLNEGSGWFEPKRVESVFDNGIQDTICISTTHEKSIVSTKTHKLYTQDGWKTAGSINVEDCLFEPMRIRQLPDHIPGNKKPSNKTMYMIGLLLGDGSIGDQDMIHFTNSEKELVDEYIDCIGCINGKSRDPKPVISVQNGTTVEKIYSVYIGDKIVKDRLASVLSKYNLLHKAGDKTIPNEFMTYSPTSKIKYLLAGLFNTDGGYVEHTGAIEYYSKSQILTLQISNLLLKFGIRSYVYSRPCSDNRYNYNTYTVRITSSKSLNLFVQHIVPYIVGRKKQDYIRMCDISNGKSTIFEYVLPEKYSAEIYQNLRASNYAFSDFEIENGYANGGFKVDKNTRIVDSKARIVINSVYCPESYKLLSSEACPIEVKSIVDSGMRHVYDVSVEGNHNYVANGIVVHNCIGKKDAVKMAALEDQFRSGLLKLDWTHPQINEMWALILKQSGYSFNKCVSGDTRLLKYPDLTVEDLYLIKNNVSYAKLKGKLALHEKFNGKEGYGHGLSMLKDNIITNRIVDICYSGERNVLCLTTVSGKQIKCTANHKFPTPKGEKLAGKLTVKDSLYVSEYTTNGYVSATEKIASIKDAGIESVYDIEMADPAHNFVIDNGIVTSNSHACAYGLLSYLTAYLKTHYPVEFMSACLTADSGNVSKLSLLINECKRMGIHVLPPNINKSGLDFTPIPEKNTILFGLLAIKGLGETTIQKIIEHRPFTKFSEYLKLVKDKTATIALIKSGAFGTKDKMGLMRKYAEYLLEPKEYKPVLSTCNKAELLLRWGINSDDYKTGRKVDKESLLRDYNHVRKIKFDEEEAVRQRKFLNDFRDKYASDEWLWEFQSLSMFITSDPFEFAWGHITAYEEINNESDAVLVGIIVETQRKKDSKGNLYFFVKLYTPSGIVEIICWSSTTRQYLDLIAKGKCIAVYGRKTEGGNLIAEELKEYSEWLKDRNIVHHGVND